MKRLRVLQILNFWRLIPAYMCIYMAPKRSKEYSDRGIVSLEEM